MEGRALVTTRAGKNRPFCSPARHVSPVNPHPGPPAQGPGRRPQPRSAPQVLPPSGDTALSRAVRGDCPLQFQPMNLAASGCGENEKSNTCPWGPSPGQDLTTVLHGTMWQWLPKHEGKTPFGNRDSEAELGRLCSLTNCVVCNPQTDASGFRRDAGTGDMVRGQIQDV